MVSLEEYLGTEMVQELKKVKPKWFDPTLPNVSITSGRVPINIGDYVISELPSKEAARVVDIDEDGDLYIQLGFTAEPVCISKERAVKIHDVNEYINRKQTEWEFRKVKEAFKK